MARVFGFLSFPVRSVPPLFGVLFSIALSASANTLPPKKYSVLTSATVQESPPQIALQWVADPDATSYDISRRTLSSGWQPLTSVGGSATSWTDTGVSAGIRYEYKIVKHTSPGYIGYGYLASGIRLPALDNWGKLVLVVENSLAGPLASELNQLQSDLTGEGWTVIRRDVSMNDSPQSVKQVIKSVYDSDPANVKAVFLFGHVPVPYSGDIVPDGHENHKGAWPADVYYADMDGNWTDSTVNTTSAEREANRNTPGDGKFDQGILPTPTELMIGRVDLNNMTCYANKNPSRSELDLMRQYINKDHAFRFAQKQIGKRGLICDNFSDKGDDPISASAWRNWPGFFGADNIVEVPWDGYMPAASQGSYLWSYGSGGGSYYYSTGVATSDDFALQDVHVVFTMFMGSYFGDWNNESNFLRAALGSGDVLTSSYSGAPHTIYFPMAMGQTIGYCMWLSQNNATNTLYEPWVQGSSQVHVSLHGDPTLRLSPVKPVTSLNSSSAPGAAVLNWGASPDSDIAGYYVYRAVSAEGPYTRLTESPVNALSFTDTPAAGSYSYMVRAIKLERSPSGTYLNPSQGLFAQANVSGQAPQVPAAPSLQASAVSDTRIDLQWTSAGSQSGFRLERKAAGDAGWTPLPLLAANVSTYSDQGLGASTQYSYRIVAFNENGDSPYSNEASATTQARVLQPPVAPVLQGSAASQSRIDLHWNDVPNSSGYKVERQNSDGSWTEINRASTGVTSFGDEGLTPSTAYTYRVRAFNSDGDSPNSNILTVSTQARPLQPPVAPVLQGSAASQSRIDLQWNDVPNSTGYKVERQNIDGSWTELLRPATGVTSFVDEGLVPSTAYTYRVRAFNSDGDSPDSNILTVSTQPRPLQPPVAPVLQGSAASQNRIDLQWNNVPNSTGYKVERQNGDGSWTELFRAAGGVTFYSNEGLSPSTAYSYRVRAFNADGDSPNSNVLAVSTPAPPLQPPAAPVLQANVTSSSAIQLGWNSVPGATAYKLENKTGESGTWAEAGDFSASDVSFSVAGLTPSTVYFFRLRASNAAGFSPYSAEVSATTSAQPAQPPSTPVLVATSVSDSQVDLSWSDLSNELGYILERKNPNGTWTLVTSVSADVTQYRESGLAGGTTYTYRMHAYNSAGNSADSAEVTATTPAVPNDKPLNLSLRFASSGILLKVNGDTGQHFRIESSADLNTWSQLTTGAVDGNEIALPSATQPKLFLRAVNTP